MDEIHWYYNTLVPNDFISVPIHLLQIGEEYVIYERNKWRYNKKWYRAKLLLISSNDSKCLVFTNKKALNYIVRDYESLYLKTFKEHSDLIRKGLQPIVSKIYEEKTGQSGCPSCGPSGLISSFII